MIKVKVPATSANLGPGFDSLGCALNLYANFTFDEEVNELIIEGCDPQYQNEDNLMVVAYKKVLQRLNLELKGLRITVDSNIPISRGLGSSAALIVAGAMAANAQHGNKLSKDECLKVCNEIEGHPDNVSPALFGGLMASFLDGENPVSVAYTIHPNLKFCALIPDFEVSTHEARQVLPKSVSYKEAIYNVSRVAVLCKALEDNNTEVIKVAMKDILHEPYRKKLIDEYEEVKNICEENQAIAFVISGAGPTCLCLYEKENFIDSVKQAVCKLKNQWLVLDLRIDTRGCEVEIC